MSADAEADAEADADATAAADAVARRPPTPRYRFPRGFVWGAATAALQIEGALAEDGRGPSVWDVFCREHPERIFERATPEVACDHYHRWRDDLRLMKDLGLTGYRFSVAWPRIFPTGRGAVNGPGADFYHRLIDGLLELGIEPNLTLYHWDLPEPLGAAGGWEAEATLDAFEQYARTCADLYGDRVKLFATLNEPGWATLNGYVTGLHPPCRQDHRAAVQVATNFLAAHARAARAVHDRRPDCRVGLVLNMSQVYPATASDEDAQAARAADGVLNRWFIDPALRGSFPADVVELYARAGLSPRLSDRDRALLAAERPDFLGVNYYYPHYASADAPATDFHLNTSGTADEDCRFAVAGLFRMVKNPRGRFTDWGWEVAPEGLYDLLCRARDLSPGTPLYVTENGLGRTEELVDGTVDDRERVAFVRDHLLAVHRALAAGADVRGYYMWSLMDNFSWLNGFKKRYGFLFVDRATLARHPKASAGWFRAAATRNGFD